MFEKRNVYTSLTSSLVIHALICAFYLYLCQARKANILLLENIELIEIESDAIIQQMPKQTPPKSVLDFIKMALPVFKKPKPQDIAEPEIDSKITKKPMEKIRLDKTLETRSKPQILSTERRLEGAKKLSEIIPETEIDKKEGLAMLSPDEPAIDLAEVGRVAVGELPSSQPISLKKRASYKDLKQVETAKVTSAPSYEPQKLEENVISIGKRKPAAGGRGKPSLGYHKGISLTKQTRKSFRSGELKISQPVTKKIKKTTAGMVREAKPDKKSVEIVGPVAGRKIVTSYLPLYPDWARAKNVEADVVIRFYVSPQGKVREKLYLERTSGYSKLDKLAMEALKKWIFEPLKTTSGGDQWGIITFRYLLE